MTNSARLILLVDDFQDSQELHQYFLSAKGFRVAVASDGQEALAKASELCPDVIIMDCSLPVISGWEAIRRLKADEKTKQIPIVMLTAYETNGLAEASREAGCAGLLGKPCMPDDLLKEIKRVLDKQ